jgi:hypothetical protein
MVYNYSGLAQLKQLKESKGSGSAGGGAQAPHYTPVPMFLPTETNGENIATVQTREKFIKDNIQIWLEWHAGRAGAVVLGVAALIALTQNGIVAAFLGLGAGFCYGRHIWRDFNINMLLKKRRMFEST